MRHYAFRAVRAKRKAAVTTALGIAAAAGLCATRQAGAQNVTNFFPTPDVPLGGLNTIGIKEVHTGGQNGGDAPAGQPRFNSYNDVHAAVMNPNPPATWRIARYEAPNLNLSQPNTGVANFGPRVNFGVTRQGTNTTPNLASATADLNDIGLVARGTLRILPGQNGVHTFGVNSDDGFTLAFPLENGGYRTWTSANGGGGTSLGTYNGTANGMMRAGNRGITDSLGRIDLPAGDHPFILSWNERGGGAAVEFFAARGDKTAFDSSFRLVGQGPFSDVRGRKYAGTVQGGWNIIEMHSPGGVYDNNTTAPAPTPAQDPTRNLANTIQTYDRARRDPNYAPPGYTGGPSLTEGVIYRYNGGSVLQLADFDPDSGFGAPEPAAPRIGNWQKLRQNTQVQGANNYFGIGARASVAIDTASVYTFGVLSDDSFRFRVLNSAGVPVPIISSNGVNGLIVQNVDTPSDAGASDGVADAFQSANCCNDGFGRYNLATGTYTLEVIMNEMTGGAHVGVYGLMGDWSEFNPGFQLVGQNISEANFPIQTGAPQLVARSQPVTWRGATNASWSTGTNWTYSQEPTAEQDAVFPAAIPASGATITLPGAKTVKSLAVNGGYTFTGGSLTVNGNISVAANQTATLNTSVTTNSLQGPGSVGIGAAGRVAIRAKADGGGNSTVGGLTIAGTRGAWTGQLDVANNDLTITGGAGTIADVADQVKTGYAGGTWTGLGITSSTLITAAAANDRSRSLGFGAQGNNALVKFTFTGDANLDTAVDSADFALLAGNFGKTGQMWPTGDFNYDNRVDSADFALLAGNFGKRGNPAGLVGLAGVSMSDWLALESFGQSVGVDVVPEPTAVGLVALGSLGLLARRRRRA